MSYGRGIGFHLLVQNQGTNSTPQTSSVTVTSDSATFDTSTATFNGTTITCSANPRDNKQMVCPLPTGKLVAGDSFEAFLRFIAPTTTPRTEAGIDYARSSIYGTDRRRQKNNGIDDRAPVTLLTDIVENTTKDDTYLHKHEHAATGNLSLPIIRRTSGWTRRSAAARRSLRHCRLDPRHPRSACCVHRQFDH